MKTFTVLINYSFTTEAVNEDQAIGYAIGEMPEKLVKGYNLDVIEISPDFEKAKKKKNGKQSNKS